MMLDELRACERLAEERRVAMLTLMAEVDAAKAEAFRAGAEWMREQAARACEAQAEECVEAIHSLHEAEERTGEDYPETVEDQVFAQNVLLDQAGRLRSLPTSPPADTK